MKKLFIVRHGQALNYGIDNTDISRPLSKKGRKDVAFSAIHFNNSRILGSPIICSSSLRTLETSEILLQSWGEELDGITKIKEGYLAPAEVWSQKISEWKDSDSSGWIVGHNPGVSDLIREISGKNIMMPSSAVAELSLHIDSWKEIFEGVGELIKVYINK